MKHWLWRALAIWLLIVILESINGSVRRLWLIPLIGESQAGVLGFVLGACIIVGAAIACSRWLGVNHRGTLMWVGILWAVLTFAFEVSLGRFAMNLSWEKILAEYDLTRGGLMSLGMIILILAPSIAFRLRRAPSQRS